MRKQRGAVMTLLGPYRVIDLTNERGHLAGTILARLGAEVVAIEPTGGSAVRSLGPFASDGTSLTHAAFSRGKKSVVLDLPTAANPAVDTDPLWSLLESSDVLIESGAPGDLAGAGLTLDALWSRNPRLIVVSISPFGQLGPKANWAATDLTVWAAGGPLALCGDEDRPPLQVGVPQAFLHAGAQAASATVVALIERDRSGLGQHVDVSAQTVALASTQGSSMCSLFASPLTTRAGGGMKGGDINLRFVYPASDGYVSITHAFGAALGPPTAVLMDLVFAAGCCDEATRSKDWIDYGMALTDGSETLEEFERVKACVEAFTRLKTKAELFELAKEHRLLIAPVNTAEDIVNLEQFASRNYWESVDGIAYPGRWAQHPDLPTDLAIPGLGQHSDEVLNRVASPSLAEVPATTQAEPDPRPLAGLKVLDFMWAVAGPSMSRLLTDAGATVVRVESSTKIDAARAFMPFIDNEPGVENGGLFSSLNADKLGVTLNLNTEAGRGVARDLCGWADVICESYSPRAMKGWDLDYEHVKEINPSVVMMSTCLFGQTGPLANFAGYGNLGGAMAGFYQLTGWPDRPPVGPFGAFTDYTSPHPAAATLLAAVDHQRRTGQGCYLDFSQAEASIHFIAPAILNFQHNGVIPGGIGNTSDKYCPHGVFAASGGDEWVAVVAQDDEAWSKLAALIGRSDLAGLALAERLAESSMLEDLVSAWTMTRTAAEAEAACQEQGIAAHRVQNSPELIVDPQLVYQNHFRSVPHSLHGEVAVEGPRFILSRTPIGPLSGGPTLGEHLYEVLTEFLGYDVESIADLAAAEAFD
jgi:crotonobetainyl-CoA:carnitine CoA-transferase CaiB-like acyl-CoA transferase